MEEESLEDPIRVLPPEVALEIFSYLTAEELLVIRQVNSLWNRLVNSECLWRRLCEEKDILDYTPTIACKLSHILTELSSAITESLVCWKRTFVRTYRYGNFFDIFTVDRQCKVNRLQRINTRLHLQGRISADINENWLGVSCLNAVLLYSKDTSGQYKLKWMLMIIKEKSAALRHLYVDEQTPDQQIDDFIKKYFTGYWAVYFWCLYPKYIWIWLEFDYKIIQLDDSTKEAVITHTFLAGANEMRWDEKGVVVLDHFRVYVYQPVGTLSFTYPEGYSGQNNSETTYLPEIGRLLVINKKFLLLTPVRPGVCKFSLYDCRNGKLLSIIEEDSHPLCVTDIFAVCEIFKRTNDIFVKCYL
uniref:Uncharacterized protein n=1 Tax=Rhodnius prolixus TaxID=13249 RepID=T1I4H7_RHOPR